MKFWFSLWFALALPALSSTPVLAATSGAVLGVRSLDGEDELERRSSHALRTAAASLLGHAISDRIVSLEQMVLSHGCEDPNAACLAQIAQTLAVSRLLYGEVVATPEGHDLTLHAFDAPDGKLTTAVARQLAPAQLTPAGLEQTMPKLLSELIQRTTSAELRVESNRPGASVLVDGEPRGALDEGGLLKLELPAGQHAIRVVEPRGEPGDLPAAEERMVSLPVGSSETLRLMLPPPRAKVETQAAASVPPPPPKRRSWRKALGWTSVGLGAALAGATIYAWTRIGRINDDDDYRAYRQRFPRGASVDVCREADRGTVAAADPASAALERRARDLCGEADTLEVLQYVFLGGALVGGGAGAYLLLTEPRAREARTTFAPRFDRSSALLEASFRF